MVFDNPDDETDVVFDNPDEEEDVVFDNPDDEEVIDNPDDDMVFDNPDDLVEEPSIKKQKLDIEETDIILHSYHNDIVTVSSSKFTIDKNKFFNISIDDIECIIQSVEKDMTTYEGEYRLLKSRIASIYGVIGKLYPCLAAIITCIIRTSLITSAHILTKKGFTVHYCDTDSIMVNQHDDDTNYSRMLNQLHPWTDIEMKEMNNVYFVGKKTYYVTIDGKLKYGLRSNGPPVWYDWIYHFFMARDIRSSLDIFNVALKGYCMMYNRPMTDFLYSLPIKSSYVTLTPAAEFKAYMLKNHPNHGLKNKEDVYYTLNGKIDSVLFRPFISYEKMNMFKMLDNVFATVYNIICFNLKINLEPYYININQHVIKKIMFDAFMTARSLKFSDVNKHDEIQTEIARKMEEMKGKTSYSAGTIFEDESLASNPELDGYLI